MTPRIDVTALLDAAAEQTGLSYRSDDFVEALTRFAASVDREGNLSDPAMEGFGQDITRLLTNRLVIDEAVATHPEILEEDVGDPIVITGLPRTGTTKLQKMLASAPGYQKLPLWQALFPAPIAPPGTDPDPRVTITDEQAAVMFEMAPDFMAAHPMRTHEPEEEVLLLQLSFRTPANSWFYRCPTFLDWVEQQQNQSPAYADLRRVLQFLQWQDGGRQGRPWVLKSPIHLGELPALFGDFPHATVVHCHRNLHEAVPSLARLLELIQLSRGATSVDLPELGAFLTNYCAAQWDRNIAARFTWPQQVIDVNYIDIRDDAGSLVDLIHDRRGVGLDPQVRAEMLQWQDANPPHRFGKHVYSLERYALSANDIDRAFAGYLSHFEPILKADQYETA